VSENAPISITYYRVVPLNASLIFHNSLYEYTGTSAPEYSNQPHNRSKLYLVVPFTHRSNCLPLSALRKLCKVTSDLSNVSKSCFELREDIYGDPYYVVTFNLVITIKSATIVFHLERDGVKYGTAKATYTHDFNAMKEPEADLGATIGE
jgi:hypothetical protein